MREPNRRKGFLRAGKESDTLPFHCSEFPRNTKLATIAQIRRTRADPHRLCDCSFCLCELLWALLSCGSRSPGVLNSSGSYSFSSPPSKGFPRSKGADPAILSLFSSNTEWNCCSFKDYPGQRKKKSGPSKKTGANKQNGGSRDPNPNMILLYSWKVFAAMAVVHQIHSFANIWNSVFHSSQPSFASS